MKKIFVTAIIAMFFVTMPLVSPARQAISDNELDTLTAQEGINIGSDISLVNFFPSYISYSDPDGFTDYSSAGHFGLSNITLDSGNYFKIMAGDTIIDVGTNADGVTALNISLPSWIRAYWVNSPLRFRVKLSSNADLAGSQELGRFYNNIMLLDIKSGSMTISSHPATQGIHVDLSGQLATLQWPKTTFLWGDTDGFTGYNIQGWVGLGDFYAYDPDLSLADNLLRVSGALDIDVGTSAGGVTALNIGLPSLRFGPMDISANVSLSRNILTDNLRPLGRLWIANLDTTITGGVTLYGRPLAATNGDGMSLGFNNLAVGIPPAPMTVSWGDTDGFSGYTSAGYIGVPSLSIEGGNLMTISNVMTMDVGTSAANVTALSITTPTIQLGPNTYTGDLALGTHRIVGTHIIGDVLTQVAGSLYLDGAGARMNPGTIKIYAH